MNYIISSTILLVVISIIIYLFSINNNTHKIKNKISETFHTIKSDKLNYLNNIDTINLLQFLKTYYGQYDNIMIPKKIYYNIDAETNDYIMNNIEIIGYKFNNNIFNETKFAIDIKFIPIKNDLFVGRYCLFGLNGNYMIYDDNSQDPVINTQESVINTQIPLKSCIKRNNKSNDTTIISETKSDIFDMIPDIIHLSTSEKENSHFENV